MMGVINYFYSLLLPNKRKQNSNSSILPYTLLSLFLFVTTLNVAIATAAKNETAKLTLPQKIAAYSRSYERDIRLNTIPGSSDNDDVMRYAPELVSTASNNHNGDNRKIDNFVQLKSTANNATVNSTTANVFQAFPKLNSTEPLVGNAQSQNPFFMPGGMNGGMNPQIALLLQQNPRLQMLARQNPIVAQQIMRNPGLLRDPQIQRAIASQMSPGQGQNLLGQLGQIGLLNGLGRALNPLGIGSNGGGGGSGGGFNPLLGLNRGNGQQRQNGLNGVGNRGMGNRGRGEGGGGGGSNELDNFGLPRQVNPHQETLPGGYYGNNDNYNPQGADGSGAGSAGGGDDASAEGGADDSSGEGEAGASPDYDGNTGQEGGANEDGSGGQGGEDGQQNPAEDPDIQQLQNFGGPVNDNFPEGLFPPGLLTKEDIDEIRKQQEKQQREQEERERAQQAAAQGSGEGEQGSPDYDYGNGAGGEDANGGNGNDATNEGDNGTVGGGDGGGAEGDTAVNNGNSGGGGGVDSQQGVVNPSIGNHQQQQHQLTTTPPTPLGGAYHNAYQPIQPQHQGGTGGRVMLQPMVDYTQGQPAVSQSDPAHNNRFNNYQSGVQYEQHQPQQGYVANVGQYEPVTTVRPLLLNTFGGGNNQHQQQQHSPQHPPYPNSNRGVFGNTVGGSYQPAIVGQSNYPQSRPRPLWPPPPPSSTAQVYSNQAQPLQPHKQLQQHQPYSPYGTTSPYNGNAYQRPSSLQQPPTRPLITYDDASAKQSPRSPYHHSSYNAFNAPPQPQPNLNSQLYLQQQQQPISGIQRTDLEPRKANFGNTNQQVAQQPIRPFSFL